MKTRSKFIAMVCFAGLCHGWADPIITRQPQSQAVSLGSEAVFSVEAMGEEPTAENNFLLYQWVRIYMHDFLPEDILNYVEDLHIKDLHIFMHNLMPLFPPEMPGGGTTINIALGGQLIPVPIHDVDGAITNTLRIPATRDTDFGLYWVMVDDAFGNQLASTIAWLTVSPVRESPTSISQSGNVLKIKFNSQFGGFIERSRNLVDWVTFINVPAGESEISVNINADDHEFFRLKEQN